MIISAAWFCFHDIHICSKSSISYYCWIFYIHHWILDTGKVCLIIILYSISSCQKISKPLHYFLVQLVTTFGFPYSEDYKAYYRTIWSFFPPDVFAQALNILGQATATPEDKGISWNQRTTCQSFETGCVITIVCTKLCSLAGIYF